MQREIDPIFDWRVAEEPELDELAGMPFVLRERSSGTRMEMTRALDAAGIASSLLNVVAEMGSTEAVKEAVKARIGISIISSYAAGEDVERKSLCVVPLRRICIRRSFFLAQRKNREISPLCSAFLEHLNRCNLVVVRREAVI